MVLTAAADGEGRAVEDLDLDAQVELLIRALWEDVPAARTVPGEDAAAAAFRAARAERAAPRAAAPGAGRQRRRQRQRSRRSSWSLAVAAALVALGGVAVATDSAVLPAPFLVTDQPGPDSGTVPDSWTDASEYGSQETGHGVIDDVGVLGGVVAAMLGGIGGFYGGRAAWGTLQDMRAERDRARQAPPNPPPPDDADGLIARRDGDL